MLTELAPEAVRHDSDAAKLMSRKLEFLPLAIKLAGALLALERNNTWAIAASAAVPCPRPGSCCTPLIAVEPVHREFPPNIVIVAARWTLAGVDRVLQTLK